MHEIYIFLIFSFLAPIVIFSVFWALKKPLWGFFVWLSLLLYNILKTFYSIFRYSGFDHILDKVYRFIHSDAFIIVYFAWLPSIMGILTIGVIYLIVKKTKKKM